MVMQRSTAVMGADVEFPTDALGIEVFARFTPIPTVAAVRGIYLPFGVCEWPIDVCLLRPIQRHFVRAELRVG